MTEWTEQRFAALDIDEQYGEETVAKQQEAEQPLFTGTFTVGNTWISNNTYVSSPQDYQNAFVQRQMAQMWDQGGLSQSGGSGGTGLMSQPQLVPRDEVAWQWDAAMDEYIVRKRINGRWESYRTSSIEDAVRQYYAWA